jgi:hypothetical protein
LVTLKMQGCHALTENGVAAAIKQFGRTLQHIDMFGCFHLGGAVVSAIGEFVLGLRSICLAQCTLVDNRAVCRLAAQAPLLGELDLRGCSLIGDEALFDVAQHCKLLTKIRLAKCKRVTNDGAAALGDCTKLTHVDLSFCNQVGDYGVENLVEKAGDSLHTLDLSSTHISPNSVDMIAAVCPRLVCLRINQCHSVLLRSVESVVVGCSALQELGLSGCGNIKSADTRRMLAARQGLVILR